MGKKVKHKIAHTKGNAADENHHGDISYRHMQGKPKAPQDHSAYAKKNATEEHNATPMGQNATGPEGYNQPNQTIQDPQSGMYPGQEVGA